jgi:hypothetical protein
MNGRFDEAVDELVMACLESGEIWNWGDGDGGYVIQRILRRAEDAGIRPKHRIDRGVPA